MSLEILPEYLNVFKAGLLTDQCGAVALKKILTKCSIAFENKDDNTCCRWSRSDSIKPEGCN